MSRMLLAFDLDGTLLDDDKHIPEENLRAIAAAAERGWVPVPATGRIFRGIPQPVKELPGVRWFIVSNGAGVYDAKEDRMLLRADISPEQAVRLYEYMDTLPVIYDCYQGEGGFMTRSMYWLLFLSGFCFISSGILPSGIPLFVYETHVIAKLFHGSKIDFVDYFLRIVDQPGQICS